MSATIPPSQVLVYKRVGNLPIHLELYLPPTPHKVPLLLWFHGGGLLQGQRRSVAPHMLRGVNKYNYALISADHRLAPQVSVAQILTDVLDCVKFIRKDLAKEADLGDDKIDETRLAVSGSSAGGYLALLAGLNAVPRPKVVLAIYPITDPLGPFFTKPQPHSEGMIAEATVAPFLDLKAEVVTSNPPESPRGKMYRYMMQSANLAQLLRVTEPDIQFRIAKAITERGRDRVHELPPIYMVHGDVDQFVGVEQADEVADVLKDMGSTVEYDRPEGLDHLFDIDEKVEVENMYRFMAKWL